MIRQMESTDLPMMAKIVGDWSKPTSWMVRDFYVSLKDNDHMIEGDVALYPNNNQLSEFCGRQEIMRHENTPVKQPETIPEMSMECYR